MEKLVDRSITVYLDVLTKLFVWQQESASPLALVWRRLNNDLDVGLDPVGRKQNADKNEVATRFAAKGSKAEQRKCSRRRWKWHKQDIRLSGGRADATCSNASELKVRCTRTRKAFFALNRLCFGDTSTQVQTIGLHRLFHSCCVIGVGSVLAQRKRRRNDRRDAGRACAGVCGKSRERTNCVRQLLDE